jgi:dipeptidyl-peptidase-4
MSRICCLLLLVALPTKASELTIERIFGDPALAGPTPRAVKVSPDGRRVGLLQGSAADQYQLD